MKLLSIGDEVQQGTYEHLSSFHRAVSFRCGESLIFLVAKEIGAGPLNLVVDNLDLTRIDSPEFVVGDSAVSFGSHRLSFTNSDRYSSRLRFEGCCDERFARNLAVFKESLLALAHPKSLAFLLDNARLANAETAFERALTRQIEYGVCRFFRGELAGISELKGCGFGLTPSGDDFIAGILIGLNLLQLRSTHDLAPVLDEIYEIAKGGNLFSNAFLGMARRGRVFEALKELIASLRNEDEEAVRAFTTKLLAFGGTSGSDLATGFLMTIEDDAHVIARLSNPWIVGDEAGALEMGVQ